MLKIRDDVDLKELEKFGFKRVQQNTKNNYIFIPDKFANQNSITIQDDTNLYSIGYHIDEDRKMSFKFNTSVLSFNETIDLLYDLIKADLVEKV